MLGVVYTDQTVRPANYSLSSTAPSPLLNAEVAAQTYLSYLQGNLSLSSVQLDWVLWNAGERLQQQGKLSPHHRTRSTFY
jgi:hypothetical protein